jgi:prepilin-type N-terminal cleavage/methylation domain-containing protein
VSPMRRRSRCGQEAFTLVEIMIVLAIIGLLAALAVPSFIKNRKQSQGRRIMNDARQIDAAINAWALEVNASDGNPVDITGAAAYSKSGSINTIDLLGNPYLIGPVGNTQMAIAATTKSALAGVGIDWGAY